MDHLILKFNPKPFEAKVKLEDKIILLGSCFSDEMALHFEESGFHVLANPFGTIYHPLVIAKLLRQNLENRSDLEILSRDDLFLSWNASSTIHAYTEKELVQKYNEAHELLGLTLNGKSTMIITLGTSFGYQLKSNNELVANCHKQPIESFNKKMYSCDEMLEGWKETLDLFYSKFPNKNIIFTVSPVRHIKDGIVENNRSKAQLIELVHRLCEIYPALYFPSYELCVDVLRDYRFYSQDLVHPNDLATLEVWKLFKRMAISGDDAAIIEDVVKLKKSKNHRGLFPESEQEKERINKLKIRVQELLDKYPEINLD